MAKTKHGASSRSARSFIGELSNQRAMVRRDKATTARGRKSECEFDFTFGAVRDFTIAPCGDAPARSPASPLGDMASDPPGGRLGDVISRR